MVTFEMGSAEADEINIKMCIKLSTYCKCCFMKLYTVTVYTLYKNIQSLSVLLDSGHFMMIQYHFQIIPMRQDKLLIKDSST